MRHRLWLGIVLGCLLSVTSPLGAGTPTVCFTPGMHCTERIVQALGASQRTVLVQAYSFTSAPIAQALLKAHQRGVSVQVILDKSQRSEKYSSADLALQPQTSENLR
jgi:phosphatidylserine/phosphatidylglycerophosphate/cardiolipin synthase-like enzyme